MSKKFSLFVVVGAGLLATFPAIFGCHNAPATVETSETQAVQGKPEDRVVEIDRSKGGARVWVENCMRCHNLRGPQERSDREWDIIVHHMRVRANLTAEEHRLIRQFLGSAN